MRYVEPIAPDFTEADEDGDGDTWCRLYEEEEDGDRSCQCPYRKYRGCVEDLGLPPRGSVYVHHDGRRGTLFRRVRRHDPVTLVIVQTVVSFEHVNGDGQRVTWSLKCAGLSAAK
ncbi:hypothetical protein ACGF0D_25760 [Kitasatospora sp. NPDC048298]|uniref:hypothetical protein n=1 Tax=Kitasatospora sp. NPDC048298 TaxID=3364049 RepID=UPI00371E6107